MSIFNRRNAVIGWLTWIVAKRVLKKKAKEALPGTVEGSKRPNKGVIATARRDRRRARVLAAQELGRRATGVRELTPS